MFLYMGLKIHYTTCLKQCTVLGFAGKLMWLSVYFSTKRRSFDTAFKEWGENKMCFHATEENVLQLYGGVGFRSEDGKRTHE